MAGLERRPQVGLKQGQVNESKRKQKPGFSKRGYQEEDFFWGREEKKETDPDYEDSSDEEDNEYAEPIPLGAAKEFVQPLWVYAGGRFLWCNPKFNFHIRFREDFRQMTETFLWKLPSLGGPFSPPSPFFLFGFFRQEWIMCWLKLSEKGVLKEGSEDEVGRKKTGISSWLRSLSNVGFIIPGVGLFPLSVFLAGKGQGMNSLPVSVEGPWIRHAFSARGLGAEFKWKNVSHWLPSQYGEFVEAFNSLLKELVPEIRNLPVIPEQSTMQRRKLKVFKKYLSEDAVS